MFRPCVYLRQGNSKFTWTNTPITFVEWRFSDNKYMAILYYLCHLLQQMPRVVIFRWILQVYECADLFSYPVSRTSCLWSKCRKEEGNWQFLFSFVLVWYIPVETISYATTFFYRLWLVIKHWYCVISSSSHLQVLLKKYNVANLSVSSPILI